MLLKRKKAVFPSGKVSLLFVSWAPATASRVGENYQMMLELWRIYPSGKMHTRTWPSERQRGRTQDWELRYYFVSKLLPDSAHFREDSPSAAGYGVRPLLSRFPDRQCGFTCSANWSNRNCFLDFRVEQSPSNQNHLPRGFFFFFKKHTSNILANATKVHDDVSKKGWMIQTVNSHDREEFQIKPTLPSSIFH